MANLGGLAALALMVTSGAILAPGEGFSADGWLVVYASAAFISLLTWHSKDWPESPAGALVAALASLMLGGFSFALDVTFGQHEHPGLPALAAAQTQGWAFIITVICCPGLTIAALAGSVRNVIRISI
jgi:hypothetical protein